MPSKMPVLRIKSCLSTANKHQLDHPFQGTKPGLGRAKLGGLSIVSIVWGLAGLDSGAFWRLHQYVGGADPGEGPSCTILLFYLKLCKAVASVWESLAMIQ